MDIVGKKDGEKLTLKLSGRLDTSTAPQLQERIDREIGGILEVWIDMEKLEYISSAGLRVLLSTTKKMREVEGTVIITNANKEVREVFLITGFDQILNIQ